MNEADGSERGWSRQRQNAVHLEMIAISGNIAFDIIIIFIPHSTHGRHNYEYIFTLNYNNRAMVNAQKYKGSKLHVRLAFVCLLFVCLYFLFVFCFVFVFVIAGFVFTVVVLFVFWLLVLFPCCCLFASIY